MQGEQDQTDASTKEQRFVLGLWGGRYQVRDVQRSILIAELENQGVRYCNEMEVGPGSKQVQVKDPDGNPIELFEPAWQ